MRESLVMTALTSVRPYVRPPIQTVGVEVGRQDSLWERARSVRAIFLGGKSRGSVAFGNPRFSGGKLSISDEQRDNEQERAREKRRRNLRNSSEEILERSQGMRRRENFNENQRKAERNRARDKIFIYNG